VCFPPCFRGFRKEVRFGPPVSFFHTDDPKGVP
jgi:hypothetical protein